MADTESITKTYRPTGSIISTKPSRAEAEVVETEEQFALDESKLKMIGASTSMEIIETYIAYQNLGGNPSNAMWAKLQRALDTLSSSQTVTTPSSLTSGTSNIRVAVPSSQSFTEQAALGTLPASTSMQASPTSAQQANTFSNALTYQAIAVAAICAASNVTLAFYQTKRDMFEVRAANIATALQREDERARENACPQDAWIQTGARSLTSIVKALGRCVHGEVRESGLYYLCMMELYV